MIAKKDGFDKTVPVLYRNTVRIPAQFFKLPMGMT